MIRQEKIYLKKLEWIRIESKHVFYPTPEIHSVRLEDKDFSRLSKIEIEAVLLFSLGWYYHEIGSYLKKSIERTRQILNKAFRKIRWGRNYA